MVLARDPEEKRRFGDLRVPQPISSGGLESGGNSQKLAPSHAVTITGGAGSSVLAFDYGDRLEPGDFCAYT
jgi:hypothetical protein